jgi:hypothetical protein
LQIETANIPWGPGLPEISTLAEMLEAKANGRRCSLKTDKSWRELYYDYLENPEPGLDDILNGLLEGINPLGKLVKSFRDAEAHTQEEILERLGGELEMAGAMRSQNQLQYLADREQERRERKYTDRERKFCEQINLLIMNNSRAFSYEPNKSEITLQEVADYFKHRHIRDFSNRVISILEWLEANPNKRPSTWRNY